MIKERFTLSISIGIALHSPRPPANVETTAHNQKQEKNDTKPPAEKDNEAKNANTKTSEEQSENKQ